MGHHWPMHCIFAWRYQAFTEHKQKIVHAVHSALRARNRTFLKSYRARSMTWPTLNQQETCFSVNHMLCIALSGMTECLLFTRQSYDHIAIRLRVYLHISTVFVSRTWRSWQQETRLIEPDAALVLTWPQNKNKLNSTITDGYAGDIQIVVNWK